MADRNKSKKRTRSNSNPRKKQVINLTDNEPVQSKLERYKRKNKQLDLSDEENDKEEKQGEQRQRRRTPRRKVSTPIARRNPKRKVRDKPREESEGEERPKKRRKKSEEKAERTGDSLLDLYSFQKPILYNKDFDPKQTKPTKLEYDNDPNNLTDVLHYRWNKSPSHLVNLFGSDPHEKIAPNHLDDFNLDADLKKKLAKDDKHIDNIIGLYNFGATCYMNSFMQTLFWLLPFRKAIYEIDVVEDRDVDKMVSVFQTFFANLELSKLKYYSPLDMVEQLNLQKNVQEDPSEFFNLTFNQIDKCLGTKEKKECVELLRDFLCTTYDLVTHVRCPENHYTKRKMTVMNVRLEVKKAGTLSEALVDWRRSEGSGNDFRCEKCNSKHSFYQISEDIKFGRTVMIIANRIHYDVAKGERIKKRCSFEFDCCADLNRIVSNEFVDNPCRVKSDKKREDGKVETCSKCCGVTYDQEDQHHCLRDGKPLEFEEQVGSALKYNLHSIIYHKGSSAYQGHYVCDVKIGKNWYHFDDATVKKKKSLTGTVKSNEAYALLYVREDLKMDESDLLEFIPERLKEKVKQANLDFEQECATYRELMEKRQKFADQRQERVQNMITTLNQDLEDGVGDKDWVVLPAKGIARFVNGEPNTGAKNWGEEFNNVKILPDVELSEDDEPLEVEEEELVDKAEELEDKPEAKDKSGTMELEGEPAEGVTKSKEQLEKEQDEKNFLQELVSGQEMALETDESAPSSPEKSSAEEKSESSEQTSSSGEKDESTENSSSSESSSESAKITSVEDLEKVYDGYKKLLGAGLKCSHGKLDPTRLGEMKRVPRAVLAFMELPEDTSPMAYKDLCQECAAAHAEETRLIEEWVDFSLDLRLAMYHERLQQTKETPEDLDKYYLFFKRTWTAFCKKADKENAFRSNAKWTMREEDESFNPNLEMECCHNKLKILTKNQKWYVPKEKFDEFCKTKKWEKFYPGWKLWDASEETCKICGDEHDEKKKEKKDITGMRRKLKNVTKSLKPFPSAYEAPCTRKQQDFHLVPAAWAEDVESFISRGCDNLPMVNCCCEQDLYCEHRQMNYKLMPYLLDRCGMPLKRFYKIAVDEFEEIKKLYESGFFKDSTLGECPVFHACREEGSGEEYKFKNYVCTYAEAQYCEKCSEKNATTEEEKARTFTNLTVGVHPIKPEDLGIEERRSSRPQRRKSRKRRAVPQYILGMNYDHTLADLLREWFKKGNQGDDLAPSQFDFYKDPEDLNSKVEFDQTLVEAGIDENNPNIHIVENREKETDWSLVCKDLPNKNHDESDAGFRGSALRASIAPWNCQACTFRNEQNAKACDICQTPRDSSEVPKDEGDSPIELEKGQNGASGSPVW